MLEKFLRRIWNRRQDNQRLTLHVPVRTVDPDGNTHEVISEDVSFSGVRLRFEKIGLAMVLGHREEVPLEICLDHDGDAVLAQAQLVWAYNTAQGGSVSGWRFVRFEGNSRARLQHFLEHYGADSLN